MTITCNPDAAWETWCEEHPSLDLQRSQAWWNVSDDYYGYGDALLFTARDHSLSMSLPIYDNRDAIVGTRTYRAPAAQQYGARLASWQYRTRLAAEAALTVIDDQPF